MAAKKTRRKTTRRTGINIVAIALLCVIAGLVVFLVVQALTDTPENGTDAGQTALELHFFNPTTNEPDIEIRYIRTASESVMLGLAIDEWVAGPVSPVLRQTHNLSEDVYVRAEFLEGNTARVTFSYAFNELSPLERTIYHASLIWSLTSLNFISGVEIFVGDEPFLNIDGAPAGPLTRDDVRLGVALPTPLERVTITLFFSDETAMYLVPEQRVIEVDPGRDLEEYIVLELIKGSAAGNISMLPADVRLLSIETREGGICFVNFNAAFRADGTLGEMFMIFSVVNSLTELDHITSVQFLIDNVPATGEHFDLRNPVERDDSIISD